MPARSKPPPPEQTLRSLATRLRLSAARFEEKARRKRLAADEADRKWERFCEEQQRKAEAS
jgi:hypothetical protein